MGCGASVEGDAGNDNKSPQKNNNNNNNAKNNNTDNSSKSRSIVGNNTAAAATTTNAADSLLRCIDKYITENGGAISSGDGNAGVCLLFTAKSDTPTTALTFTYYDKKTSTLYSLSLPDEAALQEKRDAAGIPRTTNWALFIKSIAADIIKHKVRCSVSADGTTAHVTSNITLAKNSDATKPMIFNLPRVAQTGGGAAGASGSAAGGAKSQNNSNNSSSNRNNNASASWSEQNRLFVEPTIRIVKNKRNSDDRKDKQRKLEEIAVTVANAPKLQKYLIETEHALNKKVTAIRTDLDNHSREVIPSNLVARSVERRLYLLQKDKQMIALDKMYETGELPPMLHLLRALPHTPNPITPSTHLINVLKNAGLAYKNFAHEQDANSQWKSMCLAANNSSKGLLSSVPQKAFDERKMIEGVLVALAKVDLWEFDVFELEKVSGGQALMCVTLALLLRLDLPRALGIDLNKLVAFLCQVQAGYHPNPYHNSIHAADVTQVNYFILTRGGLAQKCKLSKTELFASILGAAIHDYDHPGFNNSFHSRTNAYLSTLYNDRSVLENHHLACAFSMMQHPRLNILSGCTDDVKKEIRDTMCDIVLSTDMSMHQKIFSDFSNRVNEANNNPNHNSNNWSEKPDDRRLGLSMAIKMADVSNTCRPRNLYLPWVHCLSQEFYHQGDHERNLGMPISPFMDRDKHNDLPRGQISFINFVITPMFEVGAQFLPNLRFCTEISTSNKQYWQQYQVMRQS